MRNSRWKIVPYIVKAVARKMDVGIFLTEVVDPRLDSAAALEQRTKLKQLKLEKARAFDEKMMRSDFARVNDFDSPVRCCCSAASIFSVQTTGLCRMDILMVSLFGLVSLHMRGWLLSVGQVAACLMCVYRTQLCLRMVQRRGFAQHSLIHWSFNRLPTGLSACQLQTRGGATASSALCAPTCPTRCQVLVARASCCLSLFKELKRLLHQQQRPLCVKACLMLL
jgi:hypothetical protein